MSQSSNNICDIVLASVPVYEQQNMKTLIYQFITGAITLQEAKNQSIKIIGTSFPIENLSNLLIVDNHPLPYCERGNSYEKSAKKIKSWKSIEDQRLIAGIHKYGPEDWSNIAKFVGSGRTTGQCSQRWLRSLNPLINKGPWTQDEDCRLMECVKNYGDHSWTKVASTLVGRTDVQCRYRYQLIAKKYPADLGITLDEVISKFFKPAMKSSEEVKAVQAEKKDQDGVIPICKVKDNLTNMIQPIPLFDIIPEANADATSIFSMLD